MKTVMLGELNKWFSPASLIPSVAEKEFVRFKRARP
jgi:hypothetical protein